MNINNHKITKQKANGAAIFVEITNFEKTNSFLCDHFPVQED
jgi:hypothetical protein